MKNFLFVFLFCFSIQANAGIGWFLLGAALSEKPEKPQLSELQVQIDNINTTLPRLCPYARKRSGCWGQFSEEFKSYSVSNQNKEELKTYYQNSGYNVYLDGNSLIFNFTEEHKKYLYFKSILITEDTALVLFFFCLIFMVILKLNLNHKKRIKKIQLAYENSKDDLMFWEKDGESKLNDHLKRNSLPSSWQFTIEDNKIIGITYYNGRSIGRIASQKSSLYNSMKGLINFDERVKKVQERIKKEKGIDVSITIKE